MSFLSGSSQSIDMTDQDRFDLALKKLHDTSSAYNIGTYKERSQHIVLKLFYEPDQAYHEVPFKGYIADIINDKGITEIQTAAFRALHDKLAVFLQDKPVKVVYPVCEVVRTCWIDPVTGEEQCTRFARYQRTKYKLLSELLSVSDYFGEKGFSVELVLMKGSKYKVRDGYGADCKKKATKLDTVPMELIDIIKLRDADDIRSILPFKAGERLTAKELSKHLGLRKIPLWRALKFLELIEIITPSGKNGKSIIYEVTAVNN